MTLKLIVLGLTAVLLGSGLAEAATIGTGAVPVQAGDQLACFATNIGSTAARNVTVTIKFYGLDGSSSGIVPGTCATVAPDSTCFETGGGFVTDIAAACVVSGTGFIRATFCNKTSGQCTDAR